MTESLLLPKQGLILLLALLLSSACNDQSDPNPKEPDPIVIDDSGKPGTGEARDISSFELVAEMGPGWNLGNSFDVTSKDKTQWGNPLPTSSTIKTVREMGFRTLRIPITWGFNQQSSPPYTIETAYLEAVKKVVDYGFQNKMHVIINVHHDEAWVIPSEAEADNSIARLSSLWQQVAYYFQDYNDSLIFEALNEPRLIGIPEEWNGGTPQGRSYINAFNKAAVDAIRNEGGNNAKRHIMIPTWAASTVSSAMNDLVIPNNDPKVIISLHSYFPWAYAGEAAVSWGTDADKAALRAELERIRQKWIVNEQRPVILGEWGTIQDNPLESRIEYASFYAKEAADRGLLTIVWDDGGWFRILNRRTLAWVYPDIAEAIIMASE